MPDTQPATVTVCTVQPAVTWNRPRETFQRIEALLANATTNHEIDIVVLPEHFNAATEDENSQAAAINAFDRGLDDATHLPMNGEAHWEAALSFAANLARRHQVNVVAGSVERLVPEDASRINATHVFDRQGQDVGSYRKRKLFQFERRRGVVPGREPLVIEMEGVRCGVLICADLWYPELVREIAADVDVLCVPSQTVIRPESDPAYARLLWHSLAMTRAQENVLAVIISDQAATSKAHYRCGGVATITDPSAQPDWRSIQRQLLEGQEGTLVSTIDLQRLGAFREYRRGAGLLPY